jgi:hypothetical protein
MEIEKKSKEKTESKQAGDGHFFAQSMQKKPIKHDSRGNEKGPPWINVVCDKNRVYRPKKKKGVCERIIP